jgi:hypothetical protein
MERRSCRTLEYSSDVIEPIPVSTIFLVVDVPESFEIKRWRMPDLKNEQQERAMEVLFTRKEPPRWLLDMWKEIDDKTFGKGFDCFTEETVCNLGVADWKGREAIRANLRAFIDTGFTAQHHVTEYWDAGSLKVFRGTVDMTPDDRSKPMVRPTMTHFFYMNEKDDTKVRRWVGAVGPVVFG